MIKVCLKFCYLLLSIKFLFEVHGMIALHLLGESGCRLSLPPLLKKVTVTITIVYGIQCKFHKFQLNLIILLVITPDSVTNSMGLAQFLAGSYSFVVTPVLVTPVVNVKGMIPVLITQFCINTWLGQL